MPNNTTPQSPQHILRRDGNVEHLLVYQKSDVLYLLTYTFCQRFLPAHGDRTVDQMVQAARSGKQNIVEGCADGVASTELELKLLNVARASLCELREDYADYLKTRNLATWGSGHPRYKALLSFARQHNAIADYQGLMQQATDEELANLALTLCHQADTLLNRLMQTKEETFRTQGGIKERMHQVRTGYRQQQEAELASLRNENAALRSENARLTAELASLKQQLSQKDRRE